MVKNAVVATSSCCRMAKTKISANSPTPPPIPSCSAPTSAAPSPSFTSSSGTSIPRTKPSKRNIAKNLKPKNVASLRNVLKTKDPTCTD